MKRLATWALTLGVLLCGVAAEAQVRGGITSSGPNLLNNGDGTYSAPGTAPIRAAAGASTDTTLPAGVLCRFYAVTASSGTAEETIATCAIAANTLNANGMGLRFTAAGYGAANGNTKLIRIRIQPSNAGAIGGTSCSTLSFTASGANWRMDGELLRTGAATELCGGTNTASSTVTTTTAAPAQNTAAALELTVTFETATSAGDATLRYFVVELLR